MERLLCVFISVSHQSLVSTLGAFLLLKALGNNQLVSESDACIIFGKCNFCLLSAEWK